MTFKTKVVAFWKIYGIQYVSKEHKYVTNGTCRALLVLQGVLSVLDALVVILTLGYFESGFSQSILTYRLRRRIELCSKQQSP